MSISKDTINRLVSDIKQIRKNPLNENGIYYYHDETNMLLGYGLIIGPKDTMYFGGYYLFKFEFPTDYPHSPPKVTYCTNGNQLRMHPNFYRNGKVCISILNTWRGEQWTSCQTLTSILLTLCSLFTINPLLNEPGVSLSHPDMESYNKIIQYANINMAICDVILKTDYLYDTANDFFEEQILDLFNSNKDYILSVIESNINKYISKQKLSTSLYALNVCLDYKSLLIKYNKCCNKLKN